MTTLAVALEVNCISVKTFLLQKKSSIRQNRVPEPRLLSSVAPNNATGARANWKADVTKSSSVNAHFTADRIRLSYRPFNQNTD